MKKLNTKSNVYYLEKMIGFKPLNLAKIHLIDDDCNEFIVTVSGLTFHRGYVAPSEITILACEDYTSEKWDSMMNFIEYERAIVA